MEREIALAAEIPLRRWAIAGTVVALIATGLVGFLSWLSVTKAARDSDWVAHSEQVRNVIGITLRHLDEIEAGAWRFGVQDDTNVPQFYRDSELAMSSDIARLKQLVADNATQEDNVTRLESQVNSNFEYLRRTSTQKLKAAHSVPSQSLVETGRLADQVRTTLSVMDRIEHDLLDQRTAESQRARHRTKNMVIFATLASAIFLLIAGSAVSREARRSAELRSQLKNVNGELEQRVEQRTSALRESEERFRLLFDVVNDYAIYMLDPDGLVLTWNAGAERLKRYTGEEIIGQNFASFYTPEARASGKPRKELEEALSNGKFEDEALRVRRDGSTFWAYNTITPMYEESGALRGFSIIARDVTERRKSEEEIRKLNQQLELRVHERTAELEATNKELEAFTYSVSHDLRAPLRHIAGFSKMLTEECGESLAPEARHYLKRIQDGVQRMGTLVDDLLNLTRIGRHELRLQVTGIASIVKDVIAELGPDVENREIDWKIGELPYVEADPALLRVVFQNLLANAVKYTRPRQKTTIEIGRTDIDGEQVLFVRDNGVGFNMKYADKLFGVFQRLHRSEDFEGTGVGLATVHRVVQKHSGRIWAQAEIDQGATFYFTLGNTQPDRVEKQMASAGGIQ